MSPIILLPSEQPFSPSALADLGFWVDASQITGGPWVDGNQPPVWNDLSVNAHDLTSNATYRTNQINGLPAMETNGSQSSVNTSVDGTQIITATAATIYTVHFAPAAQNTEPFRLFQFGGGVNDIVEPSYFNGIGQIYWQYGNGVSMGAIPTLGAWFGTEWIRNGVNGEANHITGGAPLFTYSTSSFTATPNPAVMDDLYVIQGNMDGPGKKVAEVIVYKRALSTGERNQVKNYLINKYAL